MIVMKSLCVFLFACLYIQIVCCQLDAADLKLSLHEPPNCGQKKSEDHRNKRFIEGGRYALRDEFPWMALLGYHTRIGHLWQCGGSLISERHVLTVAHCIYGYGLNLYVVRLGELDYAQENDANPVDIGIKNRICHENYQNDFKLNDIGLLILSKSVTFTDSILPICIPKGKWRNEPLGGYSDPQVAGWGRLVFGGEIATHLQVVVLPLLDNEVCKAAFKDFKGRVIDERVRCVGDLQGDKDACDGDSGGPLMHRLDGAYYVTGLVSYGLKCAVKGRPGIYTNVNHFLPWIEQHVLDSTTI